MKSGFLYLQEGAFQVAEVRHLKTENECHEGGQKEDMCVNARWKKQEGESSIPQSRHTHC